jgi:hypothetical protein
MRQANPLLPPKGNAQVRTALLKGIAQAADSHAALDAHTKNLESLIGEAAIAASKHDAAVTDLLKRMSSASTVAKTVADLRRLHAAYNSQCLLLQLQMQHENRSYTAVSNVLKTRHESIKNSIGNIK